MKEVIQIIGIILLFLSGAYLFGKYFMKGALNELDKHILHKINQYLTYLKTKENGTEKEK